MCPLCHSKKVRRSHRQPFDFLLLFLRAKPMRCRNCSHRFHRWPWSGPEPIAEPDPPIARAPKLRALPPAERAAAAGSGKS
jgi:hypothetical protein